MEGSALAWLGNPAPDRRYAMACKLPLAASLCALLGVLPASAQTTGSPSAPLAAPTWTFQDAALAWGPCPPMMPEGCAIAVLHGDPAQPNADVFLKVPGGASIPRHRHASPERMVLVSGELRVTYDGQDEAVLRPGSYAYGPANLPHAATCAEGDPCVLFIAFELPVDAVAMPAE
jgi:hypothetical protein